MMPALLYAENVFLSVKRVRSEKSEEDCEGNAQNQNHSDTGAKYELGGGNISVDQSWNGYSAD